MFPGAAVACLLTYNGFGELEKIFEGNYDGRVRHASYINLIRALCASGHPVHFSEFGEATGIGRS